MSVVISDLSVRRGNKVVVDSLSLTLEPGKITALLGPNGAGKSSLVLALAGVLPIERGTVSIGGRPMSGQAPEAIRSALNKRAGGLPPRGAASSGQSPGRPRATPACASRGPMTFQSPTPAT